MAHGVVAAFPVERVNASRLNAALSVSTLSVSTLSVSTLNASALRASTSPSILVLSNGIPIPIASVDNVRPWFE
jgi:hypothetical protein